MSTNPILKVISENESLRQQLQAAQQQYERIWKERDAWQERAEKAETELASLKAAEEGWIPCAERMPADKEVVQILPEQFTNPISAEYRETTNVRRFYSIPGGWQYQSPFWRPLPPAPAEPAEGSAAKEGK